MKPVTKRLDDPAAALPYSPWVRLDHYIRGADTGFTTQPLNGATGTYTVQISLNNPEEFKLVTYTRSTTTLTITDADGHGLDQYDAFNLQGTPWDRTDGVSLEVATVTDENTFTATVADTGPTGGSLKYAPLPVQALNSYDAVTGKQQGTVIGGTELIRAGKANGDTLATNGVDITVLQPGY